MLPYLIADISLFDFQTDLHVRYMLRAASPKDAIRRGGRRNRRPHPGPYFACIEIPVSVKAPATESP